MKALTEKEISVVSGGLNISLGVGAGLGALASIIKGGLLNGAGTGGAGLGSGGIPSHTPVRHSSGEWY